MMGLGLVLRGFISGFGVYLRGLVQIWGVRCIVLG